LAKWDAFEDHVRSPQGPEGNVPNRSEKLSSLIDTLRCDGGSDLDDPVTFSTLNSMSGKDSVDIKHSKMTVPLTISRNKKYRLFTP